MAKEITFACEKSDYKHHHWNWRLKKGKFHFTGSKCSVDVCTVHAENRLLRLSANAISYGWLGDTLHHSERYRFMGPIRYQWSALWTSIRHPTYRGRVSFALSQPPHQIANENTEAAADNVSLHQHPSRKLPQCTGQCVICDG